MSEPSDPFGTPPTQGTNPGAPPPPPAAPGQWAPAPPPEQYPPTQQMPGQFPPAGQYPPTQQMPGQFPPAGQFPPTQQIPPTQAYPTQPGGNYPPQGYVPSAPPAPAPKKTGLIIVGAIAAAAVAAIAVLVLTGGDDEPAASSPSSTKVSTPTTQTGATVAPVTTVVTQTTLRITVPETPTTRPATTPPTTAGNDGGGLESFTDDTGTFSARLPGDIELDTQPALLEGADIPQITTADNLDAFYNDHDTFGVSVFVIPTSSLATPGDVIAFFDPGSDECPGDRTSEIGRPTAIGAASTLMLEGCGENSTASKAIFAVALPQRDAVLAVYVQGQGTIDATSALALLVLESVRPA